MVKRFILMLLCVVVFIGILGALKFMQIQKGIAMGKAFAPKPAAVTTIVVEPQKWQPVINSSGWIKAVNGVTVSTDLAGIVSEIAFKSGAEVKKGALLVKLDTQQEEAELQSAEAKRDYTKTDIARKRDLLAKKAIATAELDTAESDFRQAEAAVSEAKAIIARKRIVAPFDGYLGIRQIDLGQYVNPGANLVPLQSLDPIYVDFMIPQHNIESIAIGKKLHLRAGGVTGQEFDGEITAIDSQVDDATRNITVQGTVANPEHKLRPGMFVNVEVLLPEVTGVLAIPSSAVSFAPYGDSVFVVKDSKNEEGQPAKVVEQQFVKLGTTRGDQVSIESGLHSGDEVVTSGVFKLQPKAPVQVNNSVHPSNELQPKPADT